MDHLLETRELRYFIALADELHFGRAAERLGIAQPPLSRAISQLEQRLGVSLVERTTRNVALTPAGAVLAQEGRDALAAVAAAGRRAQRAGEVKPRLAVALKADSDAGLLPDVLAEYQADGDWPSPGLLLGGWGEQAGMLRDGRADVALLHAPFDARGLDVEPLLSEPRVLALAATHRLARRKRINLADVVDEPLPRWEGEGGEEIAPLWCGRNPERGRGVRLEGPSPPKPAPGPPVADLSQLLRLVELGRVVAFVPESVAARYPRDELAYRPVAGLTSLTLVVAWPERSTSLATAAFVRAATRVAERRTEPTVSLMQALP